MTELVIACFFVRVAQNIVGLCRFLEFLLCCRVSRIAVRMIFEGHFTIGLLNLILRCVPGYTKDLIVISLICHNLHPHYNFCETYYLVIQFIALLDDIYYLVFLLLFLYRKLGDGFVEICVEFLAQGFYHAETTAFQECHQLVVYQLGTFYRRLVRFGFLQHLKGSFTVIQYWQHTFNYVFSCRGYQIQSFPRGSSAVVVKFSGKADVFVIDLSNTCFECLDSLILLLYFFLGSLFIVFPGRVLRNGFLIYIFVLFHTIFIFYPAMLSAKTLPEEKIDKMSVGPVRVS